MTPIDPSLSNTSTRTLEVAPALVESAVNQPYWNCQVGSVTPMEIKRGALTGRFARTKWVWIVGR
jgi:hypothetical protein